MVRAAGGVVWRTGRGGVEVLLVHRPRYGDWTLPKGKLHRDEHPVVGACREVREETGVRPNVGARLPSVSYATMVGREPAKKVVDFWAMTARSDEGFTPGHEIDELAWLPVAAARERLSYPRDVMVLSALDEVPYASAPVVLVRHASAGDRATWRGPDERRPLDPAGVARAEALARILPCFGPERLISAPALRCRQTFEPVAAATGRTIEVDPDFDEAGDGGAAARALRRLGERATAVCSQRALIPKALAQLTGAAEDAYPTPKGAGWVLFFGDGGLAAVDPLP